MPDKVFSLPKELHPDFANPKKKPIGPVEIDWSNPLAMGLIFVNLGDSTDNLAGHSPATIVSMSSASGEWVYTATGNHIRDERIKGLSADGATVAFVGSSNSPSGNSRAISLTDASDSNRRVALGLQTAGNVLRFNSHDGTSNALCDYSIGTGGFNSRLSIGAIERWADREVITEGAFVGRATNATALSTTNVGLFDTCTIGGRYSSSTLKSGEEWVGTQAIAVAWNRPLTTEQLRSFLLNPYQILKPAIPLSYFVAGAAPPVGSGYPIINQYYLNFLAGGR